MDMRASLPARGKPLPPQPPRWPASGGGRAPPRRSWRRRRGARPASTRRARTRPPPAHGSSQPVNERTTCFGYVYVQKSEAHLEAARDGDGDVVWEVGPPSRRRRRRRWRELHFSIPLCAVSPRACVAARVGGEEEERSDLDPLRPRGPRERHVAEERSLWCPGSSVAGSARVIPPHLINS
jgi:hypothetical protein